MKIINFFLLFLVTVGCSSEYIDDGYTEEVQKKSDNAMEKYLVEALKCQLEFKLPKSEDYNAWGRAQSYIAKYSPMKIQLVSDFIINTYNPSSNSFGFNIVKTPIGDSIQFLIECFAGNNVENEVAEKNAHLCAYYIKSGNPPPALENTGKKRIPGWLVILGASAIVIPAFFLWVILYDPISN
jgi:hypothetical protein